MPYKLWFAEVVLGASIDIECEEGCIQSSIGTRFGLESEGGVVHDGSDTRRDGEKRQGIALFRLMRLACSIVQSLRRSMLLSAVMSITR